MGHTVNDVSSDEQIINESVKERFSPKTEEVNRMMEKKYKLGSFVIDILPRISITFGHSAP
jgi:hypothetical protein